ncbi:voltage-dependent anion channel-domain-containing protein [Clohesyomyces aquaticus]|uniref:Voltage-dependent anion channel-domain-containing protein n=1 Tax=Clohesyomyces aquaticus TaxID=1231657 RepID=A0A1Y1ZJR1_9PLEO|nr:voltage-dependent anion channel-domain-containing protein [Clohesyomyces aquaticus]
MPFRDQRDTERPETESGEHDEPEPPTQGVPRPRRPLHMSSAQTPNQFTGLKTIDKLFFILDLVMFILFNILMATRFILQPRKLTASLHHAVDFLFFGAYWVSVSLILNCCQTYGVPSTGPWLVRAMEEEHLNIADAMPASIFLTYPLLVVGPMAGTMIPSQTRETGWNMWIAVSKHGTRTQAPNVILADKFTPIDFPDGDLIKSLGTVAGLFVILFSFWFFCISILAVIARIRRMTFTLNWWAFVFPNAGLTLAAIQARKALNTQGINSCCSTLTLMLVALWFITAFFTSLLSGAGICCGRAKTRTKT